MALVSSNPTTPTLASLVPPAQASVSGNPYLDELQGLSEGAKNALKMAGHPVPPAPSAPQPGMLLDHSDGAAPPVPTSSPVLVTGPKKGQAILSSGAQPSRLQLDTAERGRLLDTGSGISQIAHRIEGSRLGKAHPFFGKLLGDVAQGAATVGDIGLSAVAPQIAVRVPGTEYHHQALLNEANKAIKQDEAQETAEATRNETAAHAGQLGELGNEESQEAIGQQLKNQEEPQKAADTHAASVAGTANVESETAARDLTSSYGPALSQAYAHAVNEAIKNGVDPASDPLVSALGQSIRAIQKPANPQIKQGTSKGKQVFAENVPGKGWVDVASQTPLPDFAPNPPQPSYAVVIGGIRGEEQMAQATKEYNVAAGSYQTTLGELEQAKTGSELSSDLAAIGLAEGAVGAGGVHRLNQVELDKAGKGVGSLGRRLQAEIDKAGSGSLPPETIAEAQNLVRMYRSTIYRQYLSRQAQNANNFGVAPDRQMVSSEDGFSSVPLSEAMKQPESSTSGSSPQYKVGDKVMYNGKQVTIKKIYPDGSFDY